MSEQKNRVNVAYATQLNDAQWAKMPLALRLVNIERDVLETHIVPFERTVYRRRDFLSYVVVVVWYIFRRRKWAFSIGILPAKFRRRMNIRADETYEALSRKLRLNYG